LDAAHRNGGRSLVSLAEVRMPTVFRIGSFRFFFYSNEGDPQEPIHIHVRRGKAVAKFWLRPEVSLAESHGFDARTLNQLARLVLDNRAQIERAWHEHFG
jgi:hypothetical protein